MSKRAFFSLVMDPLSVKIYSKILRFCQKIRGVLNSQAQVVENRNKTLGIIQIVSRMYSPVVNYYDREEEG